YEAHRRNDLRCGYSFQELDVLELLLGGLLLPFFRGYVLRLGLKVTVESSHQRRCHQISSQRSSGLEHECSLRPGRATLARAGPGSALDDGDRFQARHLSAETGPHHRLDDPGNVLI